VYRNLDPSHRHNGPGAVIKWGILDPLLGRRRKAPPGPPAPRVEPDLALVRARGGPDRLTWIGHASFLGTLDGGSFLVDPVFSAKIARLVPRWVPPGLRPADLPSLDVLLVTHNHYDHLDSASVLSLPREVPVVVPEGLGRWFRRRGFRTVHDLSWWSSVRSGPLTVTAVPARHWSRRTPWNTNRSHWCGFVVEGGGRAVYHSGDCADFDGFHEIGERFPAIDAAMLPIGAYAPPWFMERHHLNPEQAGRGFLGVGARRLVAMHWGTFRLTDEALAEPPERLRRWWEAEGPRDGRRLEIPAVGETIVLGTGGPL
jgi:L-ascorbate metabolism protein UlaG (beta-lactamase superfamily)